MGDEIEIVKAQFDRIESEGGSPEPDFDDSALTALERYLRKDRVRDLPNELKSLVARRIADLAVLDRRTQGGAPHVDGGDISGVIARLCPVAFGDCSGAARAILSAEGFSGDVLESLEPDAGEDLDR